ncbi:MAG: DUF58 domain-containing protein [Spirochaetia bacterium]|jgi:uncharacterized protein (DUF58 family)
MDADLFDKEFLRKLESLSFIARRIYRGDTRGAHSSPRRGTSLDFADYRTYQPGDDFRTIDWSIFGRLDRLFVRLYAEEEDLTVHVLLDASDSMSFGAPPKIDYARRLAAALGYVGIGSLDRVGVTTFAAGLGGALAPRRGREQLFHLLEYMSRIRTSGGTDIARSLEDYALRSRSPGLAIVITDLLDEALDGYRRGLRALLFHDFEVVLVHVLDREEIAPREEGALRLTDMETGQVLAVSVDRALRTAYQKRVSGFFSDVEGFCLKNGIEYLRTATIVPFEEVVLRYLRQGAHLHSR